MKDKSMNPLVLVLETCGWSIVIMAVIQAALASARMMVAKYMLNNLELFDMTELLVCLAVELGLELGAQLFSAQKHMGYTQMTNTVTRKLAVLGINWRDRYTTGDLVKMYEYVNAIFQSIKYTIFIVNQGCVLVYSIWLIVSKGRAFVGIISAYTVWTIFFEVLLTIYGYIPNTKKRLSLVEKRDRLNNDLTLNLNLMANHPDAMVHIVNEVDDLNKQIRKCCFAQIGLIMASVLVGYTTYDASLIMMFGYVGILEKMKIFILLASVCDPLRWILDTVPEIADNAVKFRKVARFINQEPDIIDGTIELDRLDDDFSIEFRDVTYSYDLKSQILKGISFTINKGDRVAFVGESGCGKSTLIKLLTRQIDPISGSILIDGIDIRKFTIKSLRKVFGVISQDVEIMADSLEFNIAMAALPRKVTREEILGCCKAALKSKIESLPEGLDTFVGDRGIKLSGGLKQLIALARILISKREILVLDEATAALDNLSEIEVMNAIEEELPDRTMIAVAHRLTTIKDYDTIHVIKDGRIVESGDYEKLIDKKGVFCEMVDATIRKSQRIRRKRK